MKFKKQLSYGIAAGLLVVVYCSLMAVFMYSMENAGIFQSENTVISMAAILILLVLSAAITGTLVFAYPSYLFLKKEFRAAIYALAGNLITILFAGSIVVFLISIIFRYI